MADYIDRAKVKKAVRRYCKDKLDKGAYRLDTCDANADIQLIISGILPAADVVEIKHGKWIDLGRSYYTVISQCSECSAKYDFRSPYCPNCGAKMEGEDK